MTNIELRTLAPEYNEDHHNTYVSRLNAAVTDPRNKNIALTGRYGSGKSSILDQFIKDQEKPAERPTSRWQRIRQSNNHATKVLRISINTLGPDEGEDLTNRIQKELVKQLVYRAKPGELSTSRFARIPELTWWRAGRDALVVAMVIVGLFWLFGLRPDKDSMGTDGFVWPMAVFFLLVFVILWSVRWYIGSRVVAQVSAGGASIELEGKSDSFFDKYLDELIAFFEATEPDIVVFEDLDRFDDPQIFDSLRELNTLVNTSAHWKDRPNKPLRFVYAIKDSLFEKLGDKQQDKDAAGKPRTDEDNDSVSAKSAAATNDKCARVAVPSAKEKDTAAKAVERANRTKFFEIVIPVVPFLSHSNARDHLLKEFESLKFPKGPRITNDLIDVVARHTTDMRLMINVRNEFVVYAERLLWVDDDKVAPGLTADLLFALVAYKNFHLTDFEALPHRGSVLDTLEKKRRDLVDSAIRLLRTERTDLVRGVTRQRKQQDLAAELGRRLAVFLVSSGTTLRAATVHDVSLDIGKTSDMSFWQPVGRAGSITMNLYYRSGHTASPTFGAAELQALFPEAADSSDWLDSSSTAADRRRVLAIDTEIAALRGANFKSLVENDRYTYNGNTFDVIVDDTLPSQLARDLVKRGHVDRFYAEYATVFYGKFLGVDVANFFRNSVWPNEMDIQFAFTTDGAVGNVLKQAPADFLSTRSALNLEVVDHLMDLREVDSRDLISFLARPTNQDGRQFLKTYFNSPGRRSAKLASLLAAKPWPGLFSFVSSEGTIDADEANVRLLSAALLSALDFEAFELDDSARALIARLHAETPAFRETQPGASAETLFAFLADALPSIPSLRKLSPALQGLAVSAKSYELTADNLRAAASLAHDAPLSADSLVAQADVWEYCVEHVDNYLALIESDEHTASSGTAPEVLSTVVNAQHEDWSPEQLKSFLDASAESAALPDITAVEQVAWKAVVEASRMLPNFANVQAYVTDIGVDHALGGLLTDDSDGIVEIDGLEDATEEHLEILIPRLLNAHETFTPSRRVLLVTQLLNAPKSPGLDLSEIEASPDGLLAELLRAGLVDDSEESFAHFSGGGWSSIGPALQMSTKAATFLAPPLIQGHATEVVRDRSIPEATRREVLHRLTEFAPTEDSAFLLSAASAARALRVLLSGEALMLIAPAVRNHEDVVWQLHEQGSSISAATALQILGLMSGGFAGFAQPSEHKFEVADTPSMKALLDRLKVSGAIRFQPGGQPRGRWKLRIG
ncbi:MULTISPECIES: hypothetical protein [unclassified Leucobacter]|uniref:YobI family P-loop NTPase n=1 Tax=unclassified Leucobacter TaxID=2621730 RepID=UPI00165E4DDD|nr:MULTISPECIES: hypothetical protein [unclassified Leucobacter]MBC9926463.1 hypothetical protein [Leucobacter sp. cx-169]